MKKSFIWQIMAAFILAILVGLLFGEKATYVEPLGNLFLRLIKFIIIPLILATIIVGVTSSGNMKKTWQTWWENHYILSYHQFYCDIHWNLIWDYIFTGKWY